jgi:type II secretory pathway component PulF
MALREKIRAFVQRCGAPAKYVAKAVVGFAVPGSGPVLDLIDRLIDCAHETAKDNLDALASAEDLQCVEKMFDVLLGDLRGVVETLKGLERLPDEGRKTLAAALRAEGRSLEAVKAIREQVLQLSAVKAELARLAAGQEGLLELQRRFYGSHLDFLEEQRRFNVSPGQLDQRLRVIEEFIRAGRGGDPGRAEAVSVALSREQPASAVLAVAVAASQAAGHRFLDAAQSLERAARLCPEDSRLAEMSRVATGYSRGTTPAVRAVAKKRPQTGDVLGGWLLEGLLGFGGWGQVFRARRGDVVRAVKIMHAELSEDPEFVKRFKREMGTLMSLGSHPHLVRIDPDHLFDKAEDWGCWFYVMEYVEGISLERYLEKHGALTVGQVRALFSGICEGLAGVHARGIIHRDIKPANIFIRKQAEAGRGQGVLVDFGLAGTVDRHMRGTGCTALFAAPEQLRHGDSDCRSDVYSLAATIYYSLLYNDADRRGRFKAALLPAEVPAEVRELLHRGLDNDPDERPKDAGDFLKQWRQAEKPKVAPVSAAQVTGGRWFRYEAMDSSGQEVEDCIDAADEEDAQRRIRQLGYFVTKLTEVRGGQSASDQWRQAKKPTAPPVSATQVTGRRWFRYEAMDSSGQEVKDCIEAEDEEDAQRKIRQLGYFMTKLPEVQGEQSATDRAEESITSECPACGRRYKVRDELAGKWVRCKDCGEALLVPVQEVSLSELAIPFRHFAANVKQGLPVLRSVRLLLQKLTLSLPLGMALQHVADRIERGDRLYEPMKAYPRVFPRWVVTLVKSGESGGALEMVLERVAFLMEYESGPEEKPVLAAWCRHFAAYLGSGVPILECLSCLREISRFRSLEAATKDIYESIREGDDISGPMAKHPHLFPRWVIDRVAESETTGDLDEALEGIAALLEGH